MLPYCVTNRTVIFYRNYWRSCMWIPSWRILKTWNCQVQVVQKKMTAPMTVAMAWDRYASAQMASILLQEIELVTSGMHVRVWVSKTKEMTWFTGCHLYFVVRRSVVWLWIGKLTILNLTLEGPCIIFCNIYTFQWDTRCCSTDCLLMHRCQLYMFRTVTVHPQELHFRCCMCRLWYVVRTAPSYMSR